jgi:uncharacterized PurR-regulated membrane protein YhhQ (DUF165 family)
MNRYRKIILLSLKIGIVFAIVFNLFHANAGHKKHIIKNMKVIESRLQLIMGALAAYLSNKEMERNVWDDIKLRIYWKKSQIEKEKL